MSTHTCTRTHALSLSCTLLYNTQAHEANPPAVATPTATPTTPNAIPTTLASGIGQAAAGGGQGEWGAGRDKSMQAGYASSLSAGFLRVGTVHKVCVVFGWDVEVLCLRRGCGCGCCEYDAGAADLPACTPRGRGSACGKASELARHADKCHPPGTVAE